MKTLSLWRKCARVFTPLAVSLASAHAGLIGYWNFDGNYNDLSTGNHPAAAGAGTQAPLLSTDVPRQFSSKANARSLDIRDRSTPDTGTNCYAFVPSSGSLYNMPSSFAISCWVKGWPVAGNQWNPFLSKNGEPNGWQLRKSADGNEFDFTTRGSTTGFANGNGDFNTATSVVTNAGGTSPGLRPAEWFHYCGVFDGTNKSIYINGQLVAQQANPGATLTPSTNLLVFGARDNGGIGGFTKVMLDDVAIWDNSLTSLQVMDLFTGTDARYVHDAVTPLNLGEPWGTTGKLGVMETRVTGGVVVNGANIAFGVLANGVSTTNSTLTQLYFKDPDNAGGGGGAPNNYLSNVAGDDNNFVQTVSACLRIPTSGDYTFAFNGDDGFQAAIYGVNWTKINLHNGTASLNGNILSNMVPTGDSNTYAVANLPAGDYNFRYVWFEQAGGAFNRVRIASGDKSGDDGTFKTLGDPTSNVTLVDQAPIIFGFTPSAGSVLTTPTPVPATITFTWDTKFATALAITPTLPGNPTLTPGVGTVTIPSPSTTTTYTLTATNGTQTRTQNVTIYVDLPPVINSFTIADSTVVAGAPITLNWSAVGAASLSIDNGVGSVTPLTGGSLTFNAPAADTTYTLTATNSFGSVTANVLLDIGLPPVINSFTAGDANIMPEGSAALSWNVSNAVTQIITPRPGSVSPTGTYSDRIVVPTTYTLTAENPYKIVTQTTSVNVASPMYIRADGWTVTQIKATADPNFGNVIPTVNNLTILDELFSGVRPGTTATSTGVVKINYGDSAAGAFPGGEILPPGGNGDNFVMKSTATLLVNFPGDYIFGINNDDGGRLRVDGQDVIINNTTQGPTTITGNISLTPGQHTIEYVMFEQGGGFAAECFYLRKDGSAVILEAGNGAISIPTSTVVINEFLASNSDGIKDFDGQSSDWIELYNGTASPVSLAGYYLTDNAAVKNKWAFPTVSPHTIAAGEYFVVFASSKNIVYPNDEYHTNFSISAGGGYLALTKDDGAGGFTIVQEFNPYPAQSTDHSYGKYDIEQFTGYFATPTPGGPNVGGYLGFLGDTHFSVKRGIKSAPFSLSITADVPTSTIRYTTDGSAPTQSTGLIYSGPLAISNTTVVRAAAFQTDYYPTNVDTHSYVFVADTLAQTQASVLAKGWPLGPVAGQVLDYGMNPSVVSANSADITTALTQIPTVCITTDLPNLLDPITGVYVSSNQRGENWERPASFEILNDSASADDTTGAVEKQIDCGLRVRGGASRNDANPKHAFRLFFNKDYEGAFDYALFGKEGASKFKNLDIQCPQNYSWNNEPNTSPGAAYQCNTFMRELFARDTQRDMGQAYTRTRHYHLYINGVYWGLFASQERAENSFGESYLGGDEDNYDVVKSSGGAGGYLTEATDGTIVQGTSAAPGSAWSRLWFRARELRTTAVDETARTQLYFEMQGLGANGTTALNPATAPKVLDPDNLADYMLDTFFTGGFDSPLSTFLANGSNNWFGLRDRAANRGFVYISHDNEHSMGAEGDTANARSTDRTGPWGGLGTNYKGQAMYNTIGDYTRSNPQYLNEDLAFAKEYRVKFGDRAHKAFFNNGALSLAAVNARLDARANILDPVIVAESARWGDARQTASFTKADWLSAKTRLYNWVLRGSNEELIAGSGIGRQARIIAQLRAYKDKASGTSAGASDATLVSMPLYPLFDAPIFGQLGGLINSGGSFTLTNPNSVGDVGTIYYRLDQQDPREIGGGIRSGSLTVASGGSVFPVSSGLIKARIYQTSTQEWSALAEFSFIVGVPASSSNLVISEMNFNPIGGVPGTALDKQDYEFMELWNFSNNTIQLDGVTITGITFNFTANSSILTMAPDARIVIVKNLDAFKSRYADTNGLYAKIAGVYTGSQDNSGETIIVRNTTTNQDIANFAYNDGADIAWPKGPDGDGYTLCFTTTNPGSADKSLGSNWFSHGTKFGNPGGPDNSSFNSFASGAGVPATKDDSDFDGVDNLLEYALGTAPGNSSSRNLPVASTDQIMVSPSLTPAAYQTISFTKRLGATDLTYKVQTSPEMSAWTANAVLVSRTQNADGTETMVYRAPTPISGPNRLFMRVEVELTPP